jgi:glucose/mannose transport system substrate-binding protein
MRNRGQLAQKIANAIVRRTLGNLSNTMRAQRTILPGLALLAGILVQAAHAAAPRAEVMHWWTAGGESAAVRTLANAYRAAGGVWVDTAIAGNEQARAIAVSRVVGGQPPTAALFNTSKQFLDLVEQGLLNNVDAVALRDGWAQFLPGPVLSAIRIRGHYYAAPVSLHMPTWIWYSKAAFRKAGITKEPATIDELLGALDRLKAAGLIPLAHGGQAWQENILFRAMLANVGGRDLYLKVVRDRDQTAIQSAAFRGVLLMFKRMHDYIDAGAPGRNWNDATALVITGKAGVQIMGDWVKAEFAVAKQVPERDYGCIPGLGPRSPYIVQGDAFVFPKSDDKDVAAAQQLLAHVVTSPAAQLAFSAQKGSLPIGRSFDPARLDPCARKGFAIMADPERVVGNDENYLTPDQNGTLSDILTDYFNRDVPVQTVQKNIARALAN